MKERRKIMKRPFDKKEKDFCKWKIEKLKKFLETCTNEKEIEEAKQQIERNKAWIDLFNTKIKKELDK